MSDVTYRVTAEAQISGNPLLDYEYKKDLLKILNEFSDGEIERMAKQDSNRFFYKGGASDLEKKIKKEMPTKLQKKLQMQANREQRKSNTISNKFIANNFKTTYTRGGHKYVNGFRQY